MVLLMLLIPVNLPLRWLLSMLLDRLFAFTINFIAHIFFVFVYLFLASFLDNLWCCLMQQCYAASRPVILEPVMLVELKVPTEFQGAVAGDLNK
jgi:hypothetical protein